MFENGILQSALHYIMLSVTSESDWSLELERLRMRHSVLSVGISTLYYTPHSNLHPRIIVGRNPKNKIGIKGNLHILALLEA